MLVGGGLAVGAFTLVTVLGGPGAGTSVQRTETCTDAVWVVPVEQPPRCGCPAPITAAGLNTRTAGRQTGAHLEAP
jgi:hypothetical protein